MPALSVLVTVHVLGECGTCDDTPTGDRGERSPPAAALVLSARGICLQRACINALCRLRLSSLIDSFTTSVALPAGVIIHRSWLSANSSAELAFQLLVYKSKTSGEQSGDSHMPIWLWAACEAPRVTQKAKPGSKQFCQPGD